MSRLEELIQELCPDGVEYKSLGQLCHLEKGVTPIQKAIPGEYPLVVTTEERKSSNTFQFDSPTVCIPLVSSRGHGVASLNQIYYQENKFALGNILCGVTPINQEELSARFLYDYLNCKKDVKLVPLMRGGANVSLTIDSLKRVRVPVPPIKVQQLVVSILDKFIDLNGLLAKELTARKQQYGYYRNELLYSNIQLETRDVCLGKICNIISGFPFDSSEMTDSGIRLMRGMNIKRGELDFSERLNKYWNSKEGLEKFVLKADDIVVSMDGSLVGKSYGYVHKEQLPLLLVQRVARIRTDKENPRYIYHYLASGAFTRYVEKKKTKGAIPHISLKDISEFKIKLPALEVQNKIVDVLDNFDTICFDLNIGLPAEIEARQKQYEYYRDKLLTFDMSAITISRQTDRQTDRLTDRQTGLIKLYQYVFGYAKMQLKDLVTVFRGEYITKQGTQDGNVPVILGGQEPAYYIDHANHQGEVVVVARSGASAGFVSYWNEPIFITDGFGYEAAEEWILPKYLYYFLKNIEKQLNNMKRGAGVPHVSGSKLLSLEVTVPALSEQKKMISILDSFDHLCNDISEGLPAEIEARQKQYEYYRYKLLTFKEKSA